MRKPESFRNWNLLRTSAFLHRNLPSSSFQLLLLLPTSKKSLCFRVCPFVCVSDYTSLFVARWLLLTQKFINENFLRGGAWSSDQVIRFRRRFGSQSQFRNFVKSRNEQIISILSQMYSPDDGTSLGGGLWSVIASWCFCYCCCRKCQLMVLFMLIQFNNTHIIV